MAQNATALTLHAPHVQSQRAQRLTRRNLHDQYRAFRHRVAQLCDPAVAQVPQNANELLSHRAAVYSAAAAAAQRKIDAMTERQRSEVLLREHDAMTGIQRGTLQKDEKGDGDGKSGVLGLDTIWRTGVYCDVDELETDITEAEKWVAHVTEITEKEYWAAERYRGEMGVGSIEARKRVHEMVLKMGFTYSLPFTAYEKFMWEAVGERFALLARYRQTHARIAYPAREIFTLEAEIQGRDVVQRSLPAPRAWDPALHWLARPLVPRTELDETEEKAARPGDAWWADEVQELGEGMVEHWLGKEMLGKIDESL